ncbi:uncharacterized protein LOC127751451 [Frankliniella occidentalis]|uniref:Uncharacterized protein LOC127751451 n=1 Tax=Frankliniella occidentalis TaxID=133901 RepID=A0A9C6X8A1_FRAOC|nr:uncharacterized protein LOC127751451 [Frankliniella occidentalis]
MWINLTRVTLLKTHLMPTLKMNLMVANGCDPGVSDTTLAASGNPANKRDRTADELDPNSEIKILIKMRTGCLLDKDCILILNDYLVFKVPLELYVLFVFL